MATDQRLDEIHDQMDDLLYAGKFDDVDEIFRTADVNRLDVDEMLGLLVSTIGARSKLTARKEFVSRVKAKIAELAEPFSPHLLDGLE